MSRKMKFIVTFILTAIVFSIIVCISSIVIFANNYCTIVVNYLYKDGTPAYEPYIAVFENGSNINIKVKSPDIFGYTPKQSLQEGAADASEIELNFENISQSHSINVYYLPKEVPYQVRVFMQNIEDDLYKENLELGEDIYKRVGLTGDAPEKFDIEFEGFTQLFHNSDKIAADGSTVFEIYYDRNYTLVNFNLDGGYGVEPVYAKYGSTYNIPEPTKAGYEFNGWALTNADGQYIDSDNNIIDAAEAESAAEKFTSGTVPANDIYYKAVWKAVETTYNIVYRIQNIDGKSYGFAKSVQKTALSGSTVSGEDDWDGGFEEENLDFPQGKNPKGYFVYNEELTNRNSKDVIVEGDGSTIVNVYYNRREYTLKFYFAWQRGGQYRVCTNTGAYSTGNSLIDLDRIYFRIGSNEIANFSGDIPTKIGDFDVKTISYKPSGQTQDAEFYYIELKALYGQDISDVWPIQCIPPITAANGVKYYCLTWACPKGSYWVNHSATETAGNNNITTLYEHLDYRVISEENPENTEVNLLAYWSSSDYSGFREWNYNLYVEMLDDDTQPSDKEYNGKKYLLEENFDIFSTRADLAGQSDTKLKGFTFSGNKEWQKLADNCTYDYVDSSGAKQQDTINKAYQQADFYYTRNNYNLVFQNGNTKDTYTVPYETDLSKYSYIQDSIEYYDESLKDYYNFSSWYTTPTFEAGTEFDLNTNTMPANGLILYAKWTPIEYNITFYNDLEKYTKNEEIKSVSVARGNVALTKDIPSSSNGLTPPSRSSAFSGWYYLDTNGNAVRFDPSTMPITNDLRLYAGWTSKSISSYTIKYVEVNTGIEVADTTQGKAFVSTTKTFNAKGGSDLNDSHKTGWWPTLSSHSILISDSETQNVFTFEYIRKPK